MIIALHSRIFTRAVKFPEPAVTIPIEVRPREESLYGLMLFSASTVLKPSPRPLYLGGESNLVLFHQL
jgi:hypothetical protein